VREYQGGIDDRRMNEFQGPKVVLEAVADEDGVRVDEPHHIVLNFPESFGRTSLQVSSAYAGKPSVVIKDVALGYDESFVDQASLHPDHRELDQLETAGGETHFAVERIDAVVAVRGITFPGLGADESVEGAVHSGLGQVAPNMDATGAATSGSLRRRCAAASKPVVVGGPAFLGPQLAPVVGAAFFTEILSLRSDIKDL